MGHLRTLKSGAPAQISPLATTVKLDVPGARTLRVSMRELGTRRVHGVDQVRQPLSVQNA